MDNSVGFYRREKPSKEGSNIGSRGTYREERKGAHPTPSESSLNPPIASLSSVTPKPRAPLTPTQDEAPTAHSESEESKIMNPRQSPTEGIQAWSHRGWGTEV